MSSALHQAEDEQSDSGAARQISELELECLPAMKIFTSVK